MQQNILPLGCSVSAKTNANGLSDDSCLIRLLYQTRMLSFFPWNLGWKAEGRERINAAYSLKAMLQPWLSRKVKRHRFSTASLRAAHPCNKLTGLACQLHHPLRQLKRSAASLFRGNLRLHHEALYIISQHCRGLESIWNLHKYYHRSNQRRREADLTYLFKWAAGVPGQPRAVRRAWAESRSPAPLLSKDTLCIHHSFHFCQGKKLICPRSTKSEKKVFFFSPRNKCTWQVGILSFGFAEHKYTPAGSTEHTCAREPSHPRADWGWEGPGTSSVTCKTHIWIK